MSERPDCDTTEATAWFAGRLPDDWFEGPPEVAADRDEILVTGVLRAPAATPEGEDALRIACEARIAGFREETRDGRIRVAEVAQRRWRRTVSWAARCGPVEARFTTASVPVMTRLRMDERAVLDTLIEAGVARSRSEALAWCVRLVSEHQGDWINRLREAMSAVADVRADGPDL